MKHFTNRLIETNGFLVSLEEVNKTPVFTKDGFFTKSNFC